MVNPIEPSFPYFILNGEIYNGSHFSYDLLQNSNYVYEVIRVINEKPLFLQDHLFRLSHSCFKMEIEYDDEKTTHWITKFLSTQKVAECNFKLIISRNKSSSDVLAYFIPSKYPTPQQYAIGVDTELHHLVRNNPSIKAENRLLRGKVDEIIRQRGVYEVLLVNENGEITEGSRSNFFTVKGDTIFTAPLNQVLEGITRKKVLQIAAENGIEYVEQPIGVETLSSFDGAFLTGTSPMVLPIRRIGDVKYSCIPLAIQQTVELYRQLVVSYLEKVP